MRSFFFLRLLYCSRSLLGFCMTIFSLAQNATNANQVKQDIKCDKGDVVGVLNEGPNSAPENEVEGNTEETHRKG